MTVTETDPFLEAEFAANAQFWGDRARAAERAEAARLETLALKGQTVEVVKGRKVPLGTTGVVFWVGESTFGYRTEWRVGFKTAEGEKHFTALRNVEVVEASTPEAGGAGVEGAPAPPPAPVAEEECDCSSYDRCARHRLADRMRSGNWRDQHRAYND